MPDRPDGAGAAAGSSRQGFPRTQRLKSRQLIRPLFRRGDPSLVRLGAGPVMLTARLVPAAQLPPNTRVQVGVAARRGLRGVARNRCRRQMAEALRIGGLQPLIQAVSRDIPTFLGVTVMISDRRRSGDELSVVSLASQLQSAIRDISERLLNTMPPQSETE